MILGNPFKEPVLHIGDFVIIFFLKKQSFLPNSPDSRHNLYKSQALKKKSADIACENIRFSSLFVAGDVSRGGTSATQQQKFHTDDRNPVRSADWWTEQLHCFSYCLRMTDRRQKATKVKCEREESLTKQSIFVEYSLL